MAKVQKKLQNYLILNRYLSSLFGFNDMEDFKKELENKPEGVSPHKKIFFTEALQTLKISNELRQNLNVYDENIQEYLLHINKKRDPPVVLKYFQYVAVLLTEVYLDKLYHDLNSFYLDYTNFIINLNRKENIAGSPKYPFPDKKNMKKLAYWSATGSGKTLLMHINMLQFKKYYKGKYDNFLLITPNEGLTSQHMSELSLSSIDHKKFEIQRTLDDWTLEDPIKVIEITKIKKEVESQDGKIIPVEAFGKANALFVDEGHKGHSTEAQTWKNNRKELVENGGFTFEYSATFGEITDKDDTFKEYASCIIFDYRYKYFNRDGFGKDYSILNLKDDDKYGDEYFTGALLSFYEQKIYFRDYGRQIRPFNLENPLMIFVGSSVSGKKNESDVLQVVKFLSRFVNEKELFSRLIKDILTDKSSLVDTNDQPIFSTKFPYLREIIRNDKEKLDVIYQDMLNVLFHTHTSKPLKFVELKNAEGEIGLKFDENRDYFGVINIGNIYDFLQLIEKDTENPYFDNNSSKNHFDKSLFRKIEKKNSNINFLIGAKKFSEGWNSYRVSSMGLLNVGKSEGAQIIQLFGRGVRLRGYGNYLKRSYYLESEKLIPPDVITPTNIGILETLNIFGLNANYMSTFRESLKDEGIDEYEEIPLSIQRNVPERTLYIPRLPEKTLDFQSSVQIIKYNQKIPKIKMDLSSKIDILESRDILKFVDSESRIKEYQIGNDIIELIDFDEVFIELLKYKDLKKYYNIYFTKNDLKKLISDNNYSILCKKEILQLSELEDVKKISKIQEYVIQLLKIHFDKIYNYEKLAYYQKNLEYEVVTDDDKSLIPREYVLTINSNANNLLRDVRDLTNKLRSFIRQNSMDGETIYEEDLAFKYQQLGNNPQKVLDFFAMNIHLFQPLIYKNESRNLEFIKISPVQLVESERDFIRLLNQYIDEKKEEIKFDEIYLLRNPSRKGIGFFETKNFYPDFVFWTIKGDEQTISFIDPKGLVMINYDDEKLELYTKIKEIESELNKKEGLKIKLNSFILSKTNYADLKWGVTKGSLKEKNILFLEDKLEAIDQLFKKIEKDA